MPASRHALTSHHGQEQYMLHHNQHNLSDHQYQDGGQHIFIPSPRCSLDCNGMSMHLPPLGDQRRASQLGQFISSPAATPGYPQPGSGSGDPRMQNQDQIYLNSYTSSMLPMQRYAMTNAERHMPPQEVKMTSIGHSNHATQPMYRPYADSSLNTGIGFAPVNWGRDYAQDDALLAASGNNIARKAKPHVASACLNCKKKHLACEAKRPCNRCIVSGKESSCVDVQHKKRGRPRLRDDDSRRNSTSTQAQISSNAPQQRRPSLVPKQAQSKSKAYREIRSLPGAQQEAEFPLDRRTSFVPQAIARESMPYAQPMGNLAVSSSSVPMAVLTANFVVVQHNHSFNEALMTRTAVHGQLLRDLVVPAERERISRLQALVSHELQEVINAEYKYGGNPDPNASIPSINHLDVVAATSGFQVFSEYCNFRLPRDQYRGFPITISLARDRAYFVVLCLRQSPIANSLDHTNPHAGMQQIGPAALGGIPSPPNSVYLGSRHQRESPTEAPMQYMPLAGQMGYEDTTGISPIPRTDQGKSTSRAASPHRYMAAAGMIARGTPSAHSSSSLSASGIEVPRSSPSETKSAALKHLQLPPLRMNPTSDPSSTSRPSERSSKHHNSTPSPARGSPHSSKRKKRRRVEIGDMLE